MLVLKTECSQTPIKVFSNHNSEIPKIYEHEQVAKSVFGYALPPLMPSEGRLSDKALVRKELN
jgi:hypothetical protein